MKASGKVDEKADVIVVGGGVAGACLQYELAARGVSALLLEQGVGPTGSSTVPAALLNPHRGRAARARQLDRDGLAAFWELTERLETRGAQPGARRSGVLRAATDRRQAKSWQRLVAAGADDGLEWLEPVDFPSAYHAPFGGLLVRAGGWLEPRLLLSAIGESAGALGARTLTEVRFTGWRPARGKGIVAEAIDLTSEERLELKAEALVLCLGAYDALACRLPRLELAAGVALTLAAPRASLGALPPLAGSFGVVCAQDRVVVSGGTLSLADGQPTTAELALAVERLRAAAAWSLPALDEVEVDDAAPGAVWHGVRARRTSGTPVVRRLAPSVALFGALAGRGFLTAPLLARRLAAALATELGS